MEVNDVKKYCGKLVLIILKNDYKYTTKMPNEISQVFNFYDKKQKQVTIDCEFIGLIKEE